jgi:uncharacterized repeat protein (TIGR01451 family)
MFYTNRSNGRWARASLPLALGLGLTLALLWAVMPRLAVEAQVVNPGFTVDQDDHRTNTPSEPHIRLEKNEAYYNAAGVVITEVTSLFVDSNEAWNRYQSGELDTIIPSGSVLGEIKASQVYSPQLHVYPWPCTYSYGFSNDVPPFDDPLVRAAFASAIDRQRLISETLMGDQLPALTFTPPGVFGHVDGYAAGIGRPYSPTLAMDLLTASGYAGEPPITLMFNTSPSHQAIAEAIRQMWIETLGITVTLQDLDNDSYLRLLREGSATERPGVWRLSWCSDYPDANNWHEDALGWWGAGVRYSNPDYFTLVEAAARETVPATRLDLYRQAETYLVMTDTAIAPLYYYVNHRLTRPDLARTYRPFGGQHLDEWSFTGDPRPLKVAWGSPSTLDPALSQDWDYVEQLFLGLTDFDETGNVVPELATGWDVSPDARVYTFTMRSDAFWTDGNPVTAYDVEYGVLRSLDPATGSLYGPYLLGVIENAQAYNQGSITDPDLVGVEALDATHVRFMLNASAAYFPVIAGLAPARPQPRWAIEAHGCGWTAPENIVTNGPYKLVAWEGPPYLRINKGADGEPGAGLEFVFNIAYWNDGATPAENTVITDTMLSGATYITDTSPFTHTGSGTTGDPIVWHLGTLPAHSCGQFDAFVQVTAAVSETITNRAQIATSNPNDQGDPGEKESEWSGHVRWPWMRVNYGHDWVGADYPAGHTFWITVTDSVGTVKATAEITSTPGGGWDGDGFQTEWDDWTPEQPDIEPGDWVYFQADDDYSNAILVGTIEGAVDVEDDSVTGPVYATWFTETLDVECHAWGAPGGAPGKSSTAAPDGSVPYFCQWDPVTEWDVLPGQDVAVMYLEPDGDRVINVFHEPAPDMRVEKWVEGNDQVTPGGPAVFNIRYRNEGDAVAQTILLTDTLPANTTYVTDTSGFPANVGAGLVTWTLGPLDPDEEEEFLLVLTNTGSPSDTLRNEVDIYTLYDSDDGDNHAEAEVHVTDEQPDLYVNKYPNPGDPAPGQTFLWEINYGNNGPVASGPVVLTDTLPNGTNVVSWYSQNGYDLWTDVSTTGNQLVLTAPAIPGHWGDRIILRLLVDPGMPVGTQLTNRVEITTANEANPDDNWHLRDDVWVRGPRWEAGIYKNFGWGRLVPGGEVGYNVHFRNHGNMATQVWVTDTLPAGTSLIEVWAWIGPDYVPFPPDTIVGETIAWDVGVLEPGEWYDMDIRLAIDEAVAPNTVITNCATIAIAGDDEYADNDVSCVVETVREPGPNLRVWKDYWWNWEGQLQYEIHFENTGTERLENVWITDTYPASTSLANWWPNYHRWITATNYPAQGQIVFWVEEIHPGDTGRINLEVDLDGSIIGTQGLAFTNTVAAPIPGDVYPADNDYEMIAYTGPDLYTEKWISDGEPRPGARITFTVRCGNRNLWPWEVSGGATTRLVERMPAGMRYVTSVWPDGNPHTPFFYDPATGLIMWDMGRLGSDDHRWFYLVVDLDADLEGDDVLLNQLEFQEWPVVDIDPNPEDNTFIYSVAVLQPKFAVGKVYESNRVAGTVVTYTLTVTNVGHEAGTNVVLSDTLPAGLTYGGGDGSLAGNDVTWTFGSIAPNGGTATGWFWGTLTCSADQTVSNEHYRVVSSDQGITTPDGDPVSFTTVAPTLSPAFDQSATEVIIGETIYFTDTSTTDGTSILAWAWDFGDGQTGSGATASHTYDALGTYTVTLTITDACGFSDSVSVPGAVTIAPRRIYLPIILKNETP